MYTSHYACDVPRGCKIISPVEVAGQVLVPGVIASVAFSPEPGSVIIKLTNGETIIVPTWLRITVDQDTAERRARLKRARDILGCQ